jgi:flagellar hook-associated protein 1
MGLSAALGIASNALSVFSDGIQVAGQNIANANTPGYIQEQLNLTPSPDYPYGSLLLGTGVQALGVTQVVDQFLQQQITAATSNSSGASTLSTAYTNLQNQLQALGSSGTNLATELSNFTDSINDLANQPGSASLAQQVVVQGQQLAQYITSLRSAVDQQRQSDNTSVTQLVSQANSLIQNIAQLNPEITQAEASGLGTSQAGSLLDQQYQDLNQLAEILPITYTQNSNGSVNVYSGSNYLVMGGDADVQQLETVPSSSEDLGTLNVQFSITGAQLTASSSGSGELIATMQARDNVLGGFDQSLDNFTSNLISTFNNIYSSGQGIDAYTSLTSDNAVSNANAALNQAGLAFTPQTGSFQVEVTNTATNTTTTSTINVNLNGGSGDMTLNSLAAQLNGVADLSATVTPEGNLQVSAASGYQFQFANDNSGTLAALGLNVFFTGNNSTNIGVDSNVASNPNLFASAQGGGPTDGSNALALSQFASQPVQALGGQSITGYYNTVITNIGNQAQSESALSTSLGDYTTSLTNQQQQISGVSLDQEAIQIMQYQQAYQASAKIVTTVETLFQTLLQM